MNKKTVSILFFGVSFCSLFASTYSWTGLDGIINNPQYYNPNGLPQLGDFGYFDVNASYTVSFPEDAVYTPPGRIYINAKSNGNTVTFDGRGAEMSSPDLETASYNSEPFKVYAYGGLLFDMEDAWGDASRRNKFSPYKFSDFLFSVSASLDEDSLHFKQGSYHFDYGESLTRRNLFFAYGSGTDKKLSITADGDTSITFAPFLWSVKGRNSLLRFAGGNHVQKGKDSNNFTYVNADTEQKPSKAVFEVSGDGTTFDFQSKITIGDTRFPNRTFSFLVNDGGTLSGTKCTKINTSNATLNYTCNSGDSLNNTTCTKNTSYEATINHSCNSGDSLNNTTCTKIETYTATTNHGCNSGDTKNGTTCTNTETYTAKTNYSCDTGDTKDGKTCTNKVTYDAIEYYVYNNNDTLDGTTCISIVTPTIN